MTLLVRWTAALVATAAVLATAGSGPLPTAPSETAKAAASAASCRRFADQVAKLKAQLQAQARADNPLADLAAFSVAGPDCPQPPVAPKPVLPAPTGQATAGRPGCVTGPGRPVVGTTLTSISVATGKVTFEVETVTGAGTTFIKPYARTLTFGAGDLAPGASYRWRARSDGTDVGEDAPGWSAWCEFTVSANAVDYRGLSDADPDLLHELGLRPDRSYTVNLTGRQRKLIRAVTRFPAGTAPVTRTGPAWANLLTDLASEADIEDEVAAESDPGTPDGRRYRALIAAISVKLGGPRHPSIAR